VLLSAFLAENGRGLQVSGPVAISGQFPIFWI
jgi:hypothetical protein